MSELILSSANDELFRDAPIKALRLAREPGPKPLQLTKAAKAMMDRIIDGLGPIQVIGGHEEGLSMATGDPKERLDVWFNPRALFAEFPNITPPERQALINIISSVVIEYTPGPEVTHALTYETREDRILSINDLCDQYRRRLVGLGAPEPADMVRKRTGAPR